MAKPSSTSEETLTLNLQTTEKVTHWLELWREGNGSAVDGLLPLLYSELRLLAERHMAGERCDHTLQATALVHEAYFRLTDKGQAQVMDRVHFLAVAAQAMRRVLLDHARRRQAGKRNGVMQTITLDRLPELGARPEIDILALEEALVALAQIDARQVRIVELRYFAGLTAEEAAEVLGVSISTVERLWRVARLWLKEYLLK